MASLYEIRDSQHLEYQSIPVIGYILFAGQEKYNRTLVGKRAAGNTVIFSRVSNQFQDILETFDNVVNVFQSDGQPN